MRPKILISRCFSQPVRYNGGIVNDEFINKLKNYVEFLDVCPEVEIGLGVPRDRLIILEQGSSKRLFQPETGKDFTDTIIRFSKDKLLSLSELDGAVLKAKSPSCGVGSTKLYKNGSIVGKTSGFFAEELKKTFSYLPIEDDGRLRDESIRKHFLIRIFAYAELRDLSKSTAPKDLVYFHSRYKYLLMTFSQKILKELGQLVANGNISLSEKIKIYREKFYEAFIRKPSMKRQANTLMHIMGHISKKISSKERSHLTSLINKFMEGKIQHKVIIELLKSFAYRFEEDYILIQKYLEPYPEDLDV